MAQRVFNCWLIIEPAADVPGEWTGHCLDFNVVSQGRDAAHAYEMIREAVGMVLQDDLEGGHDPSERRAPDAEWDRLYAMMKTGQRCELRSALESNNVVIATYDTVVVDFVQPVRDSVPGFSTWKRTDPPSFVQLAAG